MSSSLMPIYREQVISFLKSMTIKFSPIANIYNENVRYTTGVDDTDPTTWKYYLNLSGQYHTSNTMMTIRSLDTGEIIDFTIANLNNHSRTKKAYKIGTALYNELCNIYPDQVDLIKSIVYPVDINLAIRAKDFDILGYGDGFLEPTEQDVIVYELKKFIDYAVERWYFDFLKFDKYYIWAYWGNLWQHLVLTALTTRIKYLHTSNVHSYHIWWYLAGFGISNYSDVLTRKQAMFLYRNMRYIQANRGKQSNLVLLVNKILSDSGVGLVSKNIMQQTDTAFDECRWIPEFVSEVIPTYLATSINDAGIETMTSIDFRLVNAGLDYDTSIEYIDRLERKIGGTTLNYLPSKLLEIKKINLDTKYGFLLNRFVLDTLVSMINTNRYTYTTDMTDSVTNTILKLSAKDALILYYYCIHRSTGEIPVHIPNKYSSQCAFRYDIDTTEWPSYIEYDGYKYMTSGYVSTDDLTKGITFPTKTITDNDTLATLVSELFLVLIRDVRYARRTDNLIALKMLREFLPYMCQTETYTLNLSSHTTYTDWIVGTKLGPFIDKINRTTDTAANYLAIANDILSELLPETDPIFKHFMNQSDGDNKLFDRLRQLFIQLCSYNVLFLDTDRSIQQWFFGKKIAAELVAMDASSTSIFDIDIPFAVTSYGTVNSHQKTQDIQVSMTDHGTVHDSIRNITSLVVSSDGLTNNHVSIGVKHNDIPSVRSAVRYKSNKLLQFNITGPAA